MVAEAAEVGPALELTGAAALTLQYGALRAGAEPDGAFVAMVAERYLARRAAAVEVVEDEPPPPPAEPTTRPGDIWRLGDHRLLCGDARGDLGRLLNGADVDFIYIRHGVEYQFRRNVS